MRTFAVVCIWYHSVMAVSVDLGGSNIYYEIFVANFSCDSLEHLTRDSSYLNFEFLNVYTLFIHL